MTSLIGRYFKTLIPFVVFPILLLTSAMAMAGESDTINLGRFSARDLTGWEKKVFAGETTYTFLVDQDVPVLLAKSNGTASGLVKKEKIDLNTTPFLNWSWQARSLPLVNEEKSKAGDDYVARIYVIFSTGPWFWNTHALNYVWNSSYPAETTWPNAFTGNAQMLALRSKGDGTGTWYNEKRNVKDDIERIFGKEIETIEAVAIMTDSDNSETSAAAAYGDISFSRD